MSDAHHHAQAGMDRALAAPPIILSPATAQAFFQRARAWDLLQFGDVGLSILRGVDLRPVRPDAADFQPNDGGRTLLGQANDLWRTSMNRWESDSRSLIQWLLKTIGEESMNLLLASPAWRQAILAGDARALYNVAVETHVVDVDAARSSRLSELFNMREMQYSSFDVYASRFQSLSTQCRADWAIEAVDGVLNYDTILAHIFYYGADSNIMTTLRRDREVSNLAIGTFAEVQALMNRFRNQVRQRPEGPMLLSHSAAPTPVAHVAGPSAAHRNGGNTTQEAGCPFCLLVAPRGTRDRPAHHDLSVCRKLQWFKAHYTAGATNKPHGRDRQQLQPEQKSDTHGPAPRNARPQQQQMQQQRPPSRAYVTAGPGSAPQPWTYGGQAPMLGGWAPHAQYPPQPLAYYGAAPQPTQGPQLMQGPPQGYSGYPAGSLSLSAPEYQLAAQDGYDEDEESQYNSPRGRRVALASQAPPLFPPQADSACTDGITNDLRHLVNARPLGPGDEYSVSGIVLGPNGPALRAVATHVGQLAAAPPGQRHLMGNYYYIPTAAATLASAPRHPPAQRRRVRRTPWREDHRAAGPPRAPLRDGPP